MCLLLFRCLQTIYSVKLREFFLKMLFENKITDPIVIENNREIFFEFHVSISMFQKKFIVLLTTIMVKIKNYEMGKKKSLRESMNP